MAKAPESIRSHRQRQGNPASFVVAPFRYRMWSLKLQSLRKSSWQGNPVTSFRLNYMTGLILAFCSLAGVGCATVQGEKYTYKTLPANFIARARENPQTIDLTRLASASKQSDVLDRGDVVEVAIAAGLNEKDTVRFSVRIEEDGQASIPQVGRIQLAGMKMEAAEAAIIYECVDRGLYRSPNVTVTMKSQRTNRIMVAGAVKKPSVYDLPRGQCDLLTALSRAEGLDPSAGTQVVIRNPSLLSQTTQQRFAGKNSSLVDPVGHSVDVEPIGAMSDTVKVDLVSATKTGSHGYQLEDGAVVYVEKRDPEPLHVLGLVQRPGRFEFPISEELRVVEAVALAGGVSSLAANKVYVIRRKPGSLSRTVDPEHPDQVETFIIHVSLANAKQKSESNIRLQPGDVVSVEQTPLTIMVDLLKRVGMNLGGSIPITGTPLF